MIIRVASEDAEDPLPALVELVMRGEEVVLWQNGEPVGRLVRLREDERARLSAEGEP